MNSIKVTIRGEFGYGLAIEGLSYNKDQPIENMQSLAVRLAGRGNGHSKFLRQIYLWVEITATRDWWVQYDTYKIGTTGQSQSTMVRFRKGRLSKEDFCDETDDEVIAIVNKYVQAGDWKKAKKNLPEGYLQKRMLTLNYENLRNIIEQRKHHKLDEWKVFIAEMVRQVKHPELLQIEELVGEQ